MTREQTITLINLMRSLNQTDQARATYALAHKHFPQWRLDLVVWEKVEPK
jgi:TolA-binding protein